MSNKTYIKPEWNIFLSFSHTPKPLLWHDPPSGRPGAVFEILVRFSQCRGHTPAASRVFPLQRQPQRRRTFLRFPPGAPPQFALSHLPEYGHRTSFLSSQTAFLIIIAKIRFKDNSGLHQKKTMELRKGESMVFLLG